MNPFKTHGAISWHELLVADPYRARDFYGHVLGWQFQEMPMPDGSPYLVVQAGALAAGGIMKRPSDDIPPCWTFYVTADDVRDLVGRHDLNVVVPVEESPAGPFCGFFDPQGAYVSAIEYNEEAGTGAVTDFRDAFRTHGLFSWFELLTADPAAAADFYGSLFGWSATERDIPGGTYHILQIGKIGFGGIAKSPDAAIPSHWSGYVTVSDVEKTLAAAQAHGATVQVPIMEIPEVGRMTQIADPEGASVKFIEYLPMDG